MSETSVEPKADRRLAVYVTPQEAEDIETVARAQGRTVSGLLRYQISQLTQQYKNSQ